MQANCEIGKQSTQPEHDESRTGARIAQPPPDEVARAIMEALQAEAPAVLLQILFSDLKVRP